MAIYQDIYWKDLKGKIHHSTKKKNIPKSARIISKNWMLDYFDEHGKRVRKSAGQSKELATKLYAEIQKKVIKLKIIGADPETTIKFEDACADYLAYYKTNRKPKSYQRAEVSYHGLLSFFSKKKLSQITPFEIEKYKSERVKKVSKASVNRELAFLSNLFTKHIEWGNIGINPCAKIKRFKENASRVRYLSDQEFNKLVQCAAEHLKPIMLLARHTGMRKEEILSLTWKQIDFEKGFIFLAGETSKNLEVRYIPINETVREVLQSMSRHFRCKHVFYNKTGKRFNSVKRSFKTACRRAGIKDFRFHDLRHDFASQLVMKGASLKAVQDLLGHKTAKMTQRYSHLSPDFLKETVKLLDKKK